MARAYWHFIWSAIRHKWFVLLAGIRLNVPLWQLLTHDLSKFTNSEFVGYVLLPPRDNSGAHIFDTAANPGNFATAWLHHQNRNQHHWEYWMIRSDHTSGAISGCLPMPDRYLREMIADWMGASRAYTGSWDMREWLLSKLPRTQLHPETHQTTMAYLQQLGYTPTKEGEV